MRRTLARSFPVLAAAVLALAGAPSVAAVAAARPVQDPVPIGPDQYFTGLVNAHPPGQAVIYVVCAGPANTGHPAGKQPVEVKITPPPVSTSDVGYTGSAGRRITAALSPAAATVVIAGFTSYFVKKYIPTSITVPCSGTGTVAFVPAPGSTNARTATLAVTFENIGT